MKYGWEICDEVQRFVSNTANIQFVEEYVYDALKLENKRLREACEAAVKYDDAIRGKAGEGNYDLLDAGGAIARGEDLDSLYMDWMTKARQALGKK